MSKPSSLDSLLNVRVRSIDASKKTVPYQVKGFEKDYSHHIPGKKVMERMKDHEVWYHYIRWYNDKRSQEAFNVLFVKYNKLITKVAHRLAASNSHENTFDDYYCYALEGFIYSLLTYDHEKKLETCLMEGKNTLNTWLNSNTYKFANNVRHNTRMIKSSSHIRQDVKYMAGGYDHDEDAKRQYEKKRGIRTDEDRADIISKAKPMDSPAMFSEFTSNHAHDDQKETWMLPDDSWNEEQALMKIALEKLYNVLDDEEKKLFDLHFVQGISATEIAEMQHDDYRSVLSQIRKLTQASKKFLSQEGFVATV